MTDSIDLTGTGVVLKLPVKHVQPPDGSLMLVPPPYGCNHFNTSFEVDDKKEDCKCLKCGQSVSAMFVLKRLMDLESRWHTTRQNYQDEMKRLNERSRTKCEKCGEMTRVSHR